MAEMQKEGLVQSLGFSEVSFEEIKEAENYFTVATVQNRYNLSDRRSEDVLDYCTENSIAFIPWAAIDAGNLAKPGRPRCHCD